jgi:hypothetical protein
MSPEQAELNALDIVTHEGPDLLPLPNVGRRAGPAMAR